MIELIQEGMYLVNGEVLLNPRDGKTAGVAAELDEAAGRKGTMAYQILSAHNTSGNTANLRIKFDALTSHDITYVSIIQTAIASGLKEFPVPYVLTNCHNSLCAVGGTINEDDHVFGYSAAKKFGGIFVPTHQAVIHQYMREMMAGCGKMILGSDSHTRYGALGTMAIGEGGGELVKQLLQKTYDVQYPGVIAIYLEGAPQHGVGPQDVALAIIKAVFKRGFVKNKVMEFIGPGIANLTMDFRNGIDVMTTETTCLSSIWRTDDRVAEFYAIHGRSEDYCEIKPSPVAYYDGVVKVNLSCIQPMIALPFHPSNAFTIAELQENPADILREVEIAAAQQLENPNIHFTLTDKIVNGRVKVDQGVVAGCAGGTFENIVMMNAIMGQKSVTNFPLSVYPSSQPVFLQLLKNGSIEGLMVAGVSIRSAFCGPCFGAGDTPANGALSIRHITRNFPNREGSKPAEGQISSVALMDARSIAATAVNGGFLTAATDVEYDAEPKAYYFNKAVYDIRVYQGQKAQPEEDLVFGPNIVPWPKMRPLPENLLLKVASVIHDPVTTTDELIPSGETSSYRSNPLRLAEFALSRKDPDYVRRSKSIQNVEVERQKQLAGRQYSKAVAEVFALVKDAAGSAEFIRKTGLGSVIFARKPGDGSAREQAASCQRVLGGDANIVLEYATKRYRSNLINWGMIPFTVDDSVEEKFAVDDYVFIPNIRKAVTGGAAAVEAYILSGGQQMKVELKMEGLSATERGIILAGCLINYYNMA